jgi:hypothetical protein
METHHTVRSAGVECLNNNAEQLDRPFEIDFNSFDLHESVGSVSIMMHARGDINGVDEFLNIDADGFPLTLFGTDATVIAEFGMNDVEMIDTVVSDASLPMALSDGMLHLTISGGPRLSTITIFEVSLSYLTPRAAVPEPSTLMLFAFGLIGLAWARLINQS